MAALTSIAQGLAGPPAPSVKLHVLLWRRCGDPFVIAWVERG
jgi:hypothetical protein